MKTRLMDEVKRTFKPEFLNRVDDVIVFRKLTKEDLLQIVDIEINEVQKRLHDRDIKLELGQQAKNFLIEKGFDPVFGARPLKRTIQRFLEDPLSEEIIGGKFKKGGKVRIDAMADRLVFDMSAA